MKSALFILPALLLLAATSYPAYCWDCSVELDGPTWVKIGRTIDLTASGLPTGGQYYWSSSPYLVPNGSSATLTGFKPAYSDYIRVGVRYTTPNGHSCSDAKWVYAHGCEVWVNGPAETKMGEQINLGAETNCDSGGEFSWSTLPGLVADGATATYSPQSIGDKEIKATYTFPEGESSSGTHTVTVKGCTVSIFGPAEIDLGKHTALSTTVNPPGGTYTWSPLLGLVGHGATADFFGVSGGEQNVAVTYTLNDAETTTCNATHTIRVRDCQVALEGLSVAAVGAPTLITANVQPSGGNCAWLSPSGLLDQGMTAQFTALTPGLRSFEAEYTTLSGDTCPATHDTTFIKVASIASPYTCVNSGTTLEKSSFSVTSDPPGYIDVSSFNLTISPLTLSTFSQSSAATITASISSDSTLDDALTALTVVNPDIKTSVGSNLSLQTPDFVSKMLTSLGLADKAKFQLEDSLSYKLNCCAFSSIKKSPSFTLSAKLILETRPLTIVGIPIPPSVKDYVSLDLVNLKLSGNAAGGISSKYDGCGDTISTTGEGSATLKAEIGGGIKITPLGKSFGAFVIETTVSGSTSVTEHIKPFNDKLRATGSWDGLTGTVTGRIRLFSKEMPPIKASRTYFGAEDLMPIEFSLPNFYEPFLLR